MKNVNLIKVKSVFFCAGCHYRTKECWNLKDLDCEEGKIYINTFEDDLSLVKRYFKHSNKHNKSLVEIFKKFIGVNR